MKTLVRYGIITVICALLGFLTACGGTVTPSASDPINQTAVTPESETAPVQKDKATGEQKQAIKSAKLYINVAGFSKDKLVDQLVFDQYSKTDAKYAVEHIDVDWNEQAVRSAELYLEVTGFSKAGLIKQLEFDKYTTKQATYGATKALG